MVRMAAMRAAEVAARAIFARTLIYHKLAGRLPGFADSVTWRPFVRAQQIMTQHVIKVGADTTIVEAANTMLRHHVSGLPVVDALGGLIGIISEGDFIRRVEIGTEAKRGRWLTFLVGTSQVAADFVHAHGR
jgi:Mg/Co/Ni transporter MgtE